MSTTNKNGLSVFFREEVENVHEQFPRVERQESTDDREQWFVVSWQNDTVGIVRDCNGRLPVSYHAKRGRPLW